jgi:hypothetical protein
VVAGVLARFETFLAHVAKVRARATAAGEPDVSLLDAFAAAERSREPFDLAELGPTERRVFAWLLGRYEGWFAASLEDCSASFFDQEDDHEGGHFLLPHVSVCSYLRARVSRFADLSFWL